MVKNGDDDQPTTHRRRYGDDRRRGFVLWIIGFAALILVVAGVVGYHLFGKCGWEWTRSDCEHDEPGTEPASADSCDPDANVFSVENCIFEDDDSERAEHIEQDKVDLVTFVPGETNSYWDASIEEAPRPATFGEDSCDENAPKLHSCIDVLFATPRKLDYDDSQPIFGRDFDSARTAFGRASISVPLPCSDLDSDECNPIWNFVRPDSAIEVDATSIDRTKPLSNIERRESVGVVLHNIEVAASISDSDEFSTAIQTAVARSNGAIFLYVHGFNQSFDVAVKTAALMTSDLNFDPADPLDIQREDRVSYPLGFPLVFSWPNREHPISYMCDKGQFTKQEFMAFVKANKKYVKVNLVSAGITAAAVGGYEGLVQFMCKGVPRTVSIGSSGPTFAELIRRLFSVTDEMGEPVVTEVNLFLHSMGNRILLTSFEDISRAYLAVEQPPVIRIVHAAADLNHREFNEVYLAATEANSETNGTRKFHPEITVYASEDDGALEASQWTSSLSLGCRVGYLREKKCGPVKLDTGGQELELEVVDASGFILERTAREIKILGIFGREGIVDDRGHGYGQNAAFLLSDIGCAFDGLRASSGRRALRSPAQRLEAEIEGLYEPYLRGDYEARCARFEFLELEEDECGPFIGKTVIIDRFELLSDSLPPYSAAPIAAIQACAASNLDVNIRILGYTDTSGEARLNTQLSASRAEKVALALATVVEPSRIEHMGLGEASGDANVASDKGDGVRFPGNRRVEIQIVK